MFGDRHRRDEVCENKSYLLEQVVENTITKNRDITIDVFLEVGYGSVLLDDNDIEQFSKKEREPRRLNNNFYIDSFENYFVNSADCFVSPRQPTCSERYPNARFHNIDFRDTLRSECIELLTHIKFTYPGLSPLFNGKYYLFQLYDSIFPTLQSLLKVAKGPWEDLAHFIHKMISLRITRYKEEIRQDESYDIKIDFPIGYYDDFIEDLAAVILDPESEPSYYIKQLYKSISHVQDQTLHIPLKKLVDTTIARIRTTYTSPRVSLEFLEFQQNKLYTVSQREYEAKGKELNKALKTVHDITTSILDLYTVIRMMKSDYQNIIMYCGKTHSNGIVNLLSQLFPDIELSPLYENDGNQCISIPMYDGALLFTPDIYQDKPVKHVPAKKADEKNYNPRYPSRRLVALRKLVAD